MLKSDALNFGWVVLRLNHVQTQKSKSKTHSYWLHIFLCIYDNFFDGPISKSVGKLLTLWTLHLKLNQLNGGTTLDSWVLLSYLEGVKILHRFSWRTMCLNCILLKPQNKKNLDLSSNSIVMNVSSNGTTFELNFFKVSSC